MAKYQVDINYGGRGVTFIVEADTKPDDNKALSLIAEQHPDAEFDIDGEVTVAEVE